MVVDELVHRLQLAPHPEGGYFRETYRSPEKLSQAGLPARFKGDRNCSTAIYYLLPAGQCSRLHRIKADEVWHFYRGGPLTVIELSDDGKITETILGSEIEQGQRLQHVVKAGTWFGALPQPGSAFSLVGCTVAPGFDFADFELAERATLLKGFPHAEAWIKKLT